MKHTRNHISDSEKAQKDDIQILNIGPIQTLFLKNLKSLNFGVLTRPSESTSNMSQKSKF